VSAVSIIIRAKNDASETFNRVKGDIKEFSDDGQKAMGGLKAANEAMSKAMRGDLVGAAHSAASAFKALWAVLISNPLVTIAAGLAAAAVGLYKLTQYQAEAAKAAAEHAAEISKLNLNIDEIQFGTFADGVKKTIDQMTRTGDVQAMTDELAEQKKQFEQNIVEARGLIDQLDKIKVGGLNKKQEEAQKSGLEEQLERVTQRIKENDAAAKLYEAAIVKLTEERKKAADAELEAAQKVAEELDKIEQQKNADMEAALLERNKAVADALDEQTRLAEEQLKEERRIRKEAAAQAVEDAKAAAEAAAEAYNSAVAASNESFKRATNSKYRREQEKKERDEEKAAERAQRAYQRALEKSRKGITGKGIDAALKANADAFAELDALDNKLRAEDAQAEAAAAYEAAVIETAENTRKIAQEIGKSLTPA
jgi:hypothetical protein